MASAHQFCSTRDSAIAYLAQLVAQATMTQAYLRSTTVFRPCDAKDAGHLSAAITTCLRWRELLKPHCPEDPLQTKLPLPL